MNYNILRHRDRWSEYKENTLTSEEKAEKVRRSKVNSVKFKIGAQIYLSIFMWICSIVMLAHIGNFNTSEDWLNFICMVLSAIICTWVTRYNIYKIKKDGYNV